MFSAHALNPDRKTNINGLNMVSGATQVFADGAIALSKRKTRGILSSNAVLAGTSLAGCLAFVGGSVVTVALSAIGRDLKLSSAELQWLVNAELLPLAALTLIAGALGDRVGQKRMLITGIMVFGLGIATMSIATGSLALFAARFLQGLGEAFILPNSLSLLGQGFPAESKARAVGVWSAAAAVASAIAPAATGAILVAGGWRIPFVLLLPLVAAALFLTVVWIPEGTRRADTPIDIGGAVFSAVGLGSLAAGLTNLSNSGELTSFVMACFGASLVAFLAMIVVERHRGKRAMLPPSLFASRSVVGANLFTALLYGAFSAIFTLLPFVMIRGAELSVLIVGFAFIPVQAVMTIVSPLAGMLCRRFGRRTPLLAGAIVTAFACLAALRIDERSFYLADIFPAVLLLAIGMSLAIAPLTTLVLTTVEVDHAGTAAGVNAAVSRAGSLLAVALLGGVLRGGGSELIAGFHTAMVWSAVVSVLAALSVLIVEPGPHVDFIPRD